MAERVACLTQATALDVPRTDREIRFATHHGSCDGGHGLLLRRFRRFGPSGRPAGLCSINAKRETRTDIRCGGNAPVVAGAFFTAIDSLRHGSSLARGHKLPNRLSSRVSRVGRPDAADSWLILVADSCAPSTLLATSRYVLYTAVPVLQ